MLFVGSKNECIEIFKHEDGNITSLRFTPDGKTLIACGGRPGMFGAIAIADLAKKTPAHFRGHADAILAADLSADGKTLATSSYDRLIKLWDVASGREIRTLKEHTDAVYSVAFSPDGKRIASASGDRTVKVWEVATGKRLVSMGDSIAEVYAVAFSSDGSTVFAGGVDRSIRGWTLAADSATLKHTVFAHDAPIVRLVVSKDGKTIISGGEDKKVKLWELPSLALLGTLDAQIDWPQGLAVSPKENASPSVVMTAR